MRLVAILFLAALAGPAFGAVNKDGGKRSVNPCGENREACVGEDPSAVATDEPSGVSEPMVIFLDEEGNTLARMPISRFRQLEPDAKLPSGLENLK